MKKLLLLLFGLPTFSVYAQTHAYTIDFETFPDQDANFAISSLQGDWQIGTPQKKTFTGAFSGKKAAVTDTVKPYSAQSKSSMVLVFNFFRNRGNVLTFDFRHKLDIQEGTDSAKVEFSFDKGSSWLNYSMTKEYVECYGVSFYSHSGDTCLFTKSTSDWKNSGYNFNFALVLRLDDCDRGSLFEKLDSLYVRFTFFGNTLNPTKDGWMIDDISVVSSFVGGIEQTALPEHAVQLVPNPSNQQTVRLMASDGALAIRNWTLENLDGALVLSSGSGLDIPTESLRPGVYVVKVETAQGMICKKLMIE